jgi:DDE superfamily endonuclease
VPFLRNPVSSTISTPSGGVQRQYSGTAGRIENCQLGVFCAYATRTGRTLIDRELYLPKSWIADRDRCREAAVPDESEFASKPVLAQRMLARAMDAGVPATGVTADEAYGGDSKFRPWLEDRRIGYVVAVPSSQTIPAVAGPDARPRRFALALRDARRMPRCSCAARVAVRQHGGRSVQALAPPTRPPRRSRSSPRSSSWGWGEADQRLAPPRRSSAARPVLVTTTAVQVAPRAPGVLLPGRMARS